MTTLLAFLVTIAILIVIHEYGHYAVARACGVKVLRFSVGFGPVFFRRTDRHGTEWALSAVPLGGYVKMVDEREGEVAPEDLPHAFNRKSVGQRSAIVAAGPLANFLLAIALFWVLYGHGVVLLKAVIDAPPAATPAAAAGFTAGERITAVNGEAIEDWQGLHWQLLQHGLDAPTLTLDSVDRAGHLYQRTLNTAGVDLADAEGDPLRQLGFLRYNPDLAPVIGEVVPAGRAAAAGLQVGDRVLAIEDTPIPTWRAAVDWVQRSPERPLRIEIERQGQRMTLSLTPAAVTGSERTIGRIGAAPQIDESIFADLRAEMHFGVVESLRRALLKTWDLSVFSLEMLGRMVIGEVSLKNLSGPVTIADYAGRSAEAGMTQFVAFLALISVSLGVLNLLPVPLLDGGHLLYYLAEFLTGRPVPEAVQIVGQKIGAALLAVLMSLALFNDFQRLLGG